MSELIRNQKFGVEVEFTGITREMAAEAVAEILNGRISGPECNCYHTRTIKDDQGRKWKIMRDSSIEPRRKAGRFGLDEYRVEFVTPPLHYEDIELLQNIIRKFREIGAVSDKSCGIHIHVDGANHSPESLKRLVNFMTARQDLIYEALQIEERANHWCKKLNNNILKEMKKSKNLSTNETEKIWYSEANDDYRGGIDHSHYNCTRYHGVNLHSFFSKGTVEFRLFNSTLHAGKIKAYIQFCLAVSAWSIESTGRVVFKATPAYQAKQKVTLMYDILTKRLGLYGDEFKTCRLHLMKALKDNCQNAAA